MANMLIENFLIPNCDRMSTICTVPSSPEATNKCGLSAGESTEYIESLKL